MKQLRANLSLHIRHPTRDLSVVCRALGLQLKHMWKRGDERRTPKGSKIGGLRETSYCSIGFGAPSRKPLAKQIEAVLMLLKPHRAMLRRLSSTGGRISFFIGWFCDENTGETFGRQLLDAMADLRIVLDLNIYPPDVPQRRSIRGNRPE